MPIASASSVERSGSVVIATTSAVLAAALSEAAVKASAVASRSNFRPLTAGTTQACCPSLFQLALTGFRSTLSAILSRNGPIFSTERKGTRRGDSATVLGGEVHVSGYLLGSQAPRPIAVFEHQL